MDIKKIISETLNNYLEENILVEKKNSEEKESTKKEKKRDGNAISGADEAQLRNAVKKGGIINVAALARKVYPNHTPEGAQSQLRKQLEGEKNDNGSEYHLKQRAASVIRKALSNI
jgi:uncharacterized membrane protein YebE (DUF533 family)